MTRKDFIQKLKLEKVGKIAFWDGRKCVERIMYKGINGLYFVLYGNDLWTVVLTGDRLARLGSAYSWWYK